MECNIIYFGGRVMSSERSDLFLGEKKEIFTCNYSVSQQEDIKKIREKYMPKEEDRMVREM